MNAPANIEVPTGLALLRQPFPPHQISQLPKGNVMLDYVGHAALTDRLLDADPAWNWEPLAFDANGLPALDANGGLWIRLTVCGQTRLGYGHAGTKRGGDAIKELIGDALRNAAMRFGAALDLWHKGDLHLDADEAAAGTMEVTTVSPAATKPARGSKNSALKQSVRGFVHELNGCGDADELSAFLATADALRIVSEVKDKMPHWWDGSDWPDDEPHPDEFIPLCDRIDQRQRECAQATANYMSA